MQYEIENIYTSTACNRNPRVVCWSENGLVYYGACNSIAVYDPKESHRVLHTCCGHTDEVRCLRWVAGSSPPLLLSTSSDATAIVWGTTSDKGLHIRAALSGHAGAVTVGDGLQLRDDQGASDTLIITSSVDGNIKVWHCAASSSTELHDYEFTCVQTWRVGQGFCLDVKLYLLPGTTTPILACAMDDFKIILYTWEDQSFIKKEVLIGHEDWVCCLDWTTLDEGDLLLASGSQDTYIRLWRISPTSETSEKQRPVSELAPNEEIKLEQKTFSVAGRCFALKLESVLLGHSTWVHSVAWHPRTPQGSKQPLKLLSSSMDASVCVWEPDVESGVWSPSARLGLLQEDSLGIHGCVWGPVETPSILAHTFQGSMHRWDYKDNAWVSGFTIGGGHFGEVQDLCWEPGGAFLLTLSVDQTTRIHAPWSRPGQSPEEVWHELARPQVHGYDLACIAPLSRYRFASGADEKIIRCFQAPRQFLHCLKQICNIQVTETELAESGEVETASLPVLGLSNLSVSDVAQDAKALLFHDLDHATEPLREEVLWRSTLWPEQRKLYGHGYELFCLAASHSGHLLASACKAALPEHAAILLWDTRTWQEMQKLPSHQLTVTQMAFSPDDKYLLSVSRDRRFSLFKRNENTSIGGEQFSLAFSSDKRSGVHTRIIWTCCWTSDSQFFATGSREGTVVVWRRDEQGQCIPASPPLSLPQSVTALTFAPCPPPYLLAAGSEDGGIALYEWQPLDTPDCWNLKIKLDKKHAHHKTVRRLAFRPGTSALQLASCSADHSVKIFNVHR